MMSLRDQGSASTASLPGEGATSASADADALAGKRILIVEDDPFITLALEEMLAEHGLVVSASARTVASALRHAMAEGVDIALLDVNIGHEKIDPVADALAQRGVPFVFTTGCGRAGLPEGHLDHAVVEKPFYIDEIVAALRAELLAGKAP